MDKYNAKYDKLMINYKKQLTVLNNNYQEKNLIMSRIVLNI